MHCHAARCTCCSWLSVPDCYCALLVMVTAGVRLDNTRTTINLQHLQRSHVTRYHYWALALAWPCVAIARQVLSVLVLRPPPSQAFGCDAVGIQPPFLSADVGKTLVESCRDGSAAVPGGGRAGWLGALAGSGTVKEEAAEMSACALRNSGPAALFCRCPLCWTAVEVAACVSAHLSLCFGVWAGHFGTCRNRYSCWCR
jgi:hypothetical protein